MQVERSLCLLAARRWSWSMKILGTSSWFAMWNQNSLCWTCQWKLREACFTTGLCFWGRWKTQTRGWKRQWLAVTSCLNAVLMSFTKCQHVQHASAANKGQLFWLRCTGIWNPSGLWMNSSLTSHAGMVKIHCILEIICAQVQPFAARPAGRDHQQSVANRVFVRTAHPLPLPCFHVDKISWCHLPEMHRIPQQAKDAQPCCFIHDYSFSIGLFELFFHPSPQFLSLLATRRTVQSSLSHCIELA